MGGLAMTSGPLRQGLARRDWRPYLPAMRRTAYVLTLIALWAASVAALLLGMDSFWHPPLFPHALLAGAYFGALSTVSLAEEAAEVLGQRNRTARLPCCWQERCPVAVVSDGRGLEP